MAKRTKTPSLHKSFLSLPPEAAGYYQDKCYEFVMDFILKPYSKDFWPTKDQKDIMDEISRWNMVLVDSGHGAGKSSVFSWIGYWFLETRDSPCRVPCTAPTGHQLKDVLWSNFSRWLPSSLISDDLEWMATEVRHKLMDEPHSALARTSNKSANMQGQHAIHMLWLVDECYGIIDPMIWEVIDSSLTEGDDNKILMGGQPTLVSGYCAEARKEAQKQKTEHSLKTWRLIRLDSSKSPIVDKGWVEKMYLRYGQNSDVCRVRVRGLPPLGNPKAFISLAAVMQAVGREIPIEGAFEMALDPAREGDDLAVLATRRGCYYYPLDKQPKSDEFSMVAMVLTKMRWVRNQFNYPHRIRVKIGNAGGYGGGTIDILRRNKTDNIEVVTINEAGGGDEEYGNTPTIMWAEFRDDLFRIHLPEDEDDLYGQLSTRETKYDAKFRSMIESKKDYKKKHGGKSPDEADAVIMCWTKNAVRKLMMEFDLNNCVSKLKVGWGNLSPDTKPVVSLWLSDSGQLGVIIALWKPEVRKLYCVYAREFDNGFPEFVATALTSTMIILTMGRVQNLMKFDWIGNKPFDDVGLGTVRDAWSRYNVNVRANEKYEFEGAVMALSRMFTRQTLVFDTENATQITTDLQSWYAENREDAKPVVMALANLASCFYDEKIDSSEDPLKAYSERKAEAQTSAEKQVQAGEFINMPQEFTPSVDSWII